MEKNTRARNDDYLTKYIILIIIYVFSDDCEHIFNKYCLVDEERGRREKMSRTIEKRTKAEILKYNMNWELLKITTYVIVIGFLGGAVISGYFNPEASKPEYVKGSYAFGCLYSFTAGMIFLKLIQCIKKYNSTKKDFWEYVKHIPS